MKLFINLILIPLILIALFLIVKLNNPDIVSQIGETARDFVKSDILTNQKKEVTPYPTIIPLKPDNGTRGTYTIGQIEHEGPTFKQVVFDPLDLKNNEVLTVNITFDAKSAPSTVKGKLQTDNSTLDLIFLKDAKGIWTSKTKITDTVDYKYILSISAEKDGKTVNAMVAPRS